MAEVVPCPHSDDLGLIEWVYKTGMERREEYKVKIVNYESGINHRVSLAYAGISWRQMV
jgi:hypothetical protein